MSSERVVIVVLGCPPLLPSGRPNPYFLGRVETAAALHQAHPGAPILCSGATDRSGRDEAGWLAAALARRGVPRASIEVDAASARTRDSIDAAARRFPGRPLVFVTQTFHMQRVQALARRRGLEASAAHAPGPQPSRRLRLREALARVRAAIER